MKKLDEKELNDVSGGLIQNRILEAGFAYTDGTNTYVVINATSAYNKDRTITVEHFVLEGQTWKNVGKVGKTIRELLALKEIYNFNGKSTY